MIGPQKDSLSNLKVSRCYKLSPVIDLPGDHGPPCKKMRQERPKKHSGKVQKGVCRSRKQDLIRFFLQSQLLLQQLQFHPQAQPCNCWISWSFTLRQGRCCDFQSKNPIESWCVSFALWMLSGFHVLESVRNWFAMICILWFGLCA